MSLLKELVAFEKGQINLKCVRIFCSAVLLLYFHTKLFVSKILFLFALLFQVIFALL